MNTMKNLAIATLLLIGVPALAQTADSSQYYFQKGIEEKASKRWLVASRNFDRAIELNPRFTAAYLENGYVNLEMRKTDAAKNNFTKVNQLDPANIDAVKELVDLYYSYHQYQYAIDFAKKCTSCLNLEKTIALCYFHMEDYVNAEKVRLRFISRPARRNAWILGFGSLRPVLGASRSLSPLYACAWLGVRASASTKRKSVTSRILLRPAP